MDRNFKWRAIIVLAVVVVSLVYIYPTVTPSLPTFWKKSLPENEIKLGLDLRGGIHLVLEVQLDKAVEGVKDRLIEDLKYQLRKNAIPASMVDIGEDGLIKVQLVKAEHQEKVNEILDDDYPFLKTENTETAGDQLTISLSMDPQETKRIKENAHRQVLETIRNRIDEFGLTEPDIRPQGVDRIVIQLPGMQDTDRAQSIIKRTALLEFKLVEEGVSPEQAEANGPPPGAEIAYKIVMKDTGRPEKIPFVLRKRALMTGEYLEDARANIDPTYGRPYVSLKFNAKGAKLFEKITEAHVKKRLAVVLDGNVRTAPVIETKISGGQAVIEGIPTMEEATDIAIVLRTGSLPAPVKILENLTVGPSLGADSIRQGINSIILGLVLVLVFMVVYYRLSGVIADLALCFNVLIIGAGLAAFQATLTLPGIAGIILTIGMSVDANVLIFERIREETRLGKSPRAAVDSGFSKAMWTILDANVTTLIAAVVLYQFGTGPVRGFAVTLSIGILASLFTAMFVSRLIFDYLLVGRKMKAVSI